MHETSTNVEGHRALRTCSIHLDPTGLGTARLTEPAEFGSHSERLRNNNSGKRVRAYCNIVERQTQILTFFRRFWNFQADTRLLSRLRYAYALVQFRWAGARTLIDSRVEPGTGFFKPSRDPDRV